MCGGDLCQTTYTANDGLSSRLAKTIDDRLMAEYLGRPGAGGSHRYRLHFCEGSASMRLTARAALATVSSVVRVPLLPHKSNRLPPASPHQPTARFALHSLPPLYPSVTTRPVLLVCVRVCVTECPLCRQISASQSFGFFSLVSLSLPSVCRLMAGVFGDVRRPL